MPSRSDSQSATDLRPPFLPLRCRRQIGFFDFCLGLLDLLAKNLHLFQQEGVRVQQVVHLILLFRLARERSSPEPTGSFLDPG